jgi:hypothetical protein
MDNNTREIQRVDDTELAKTVNECDTAWRKGEWYNRKLMQIRYAAILGYHGWKVPTDMGWFHEVYHDPRTRDGATKHFHAILDAPEFGGSPDIHAALTWIVFQTLRFSDSPSWYNVLDDLMYVLLTTELGGVYPEDVRMPFPGFFIEIPPGFIEANNAMTGLHTIRSISVCEGNHTVEHEDGSLLPGSGRRLLITLWGEARQDSHSCADDHIYYLTLPLYDDGRSIKRLVEQDRMDLWQYDATTAERWKNRTFGRILGQKTTFTEANEVIRQFVVNFLLYITHHPGDVVHANQERVAQLRGPVRKIRGKAKRPKLSQSKRSLIQKLLAEPSWTVGSRINLDTRFKHAVRKHGVARKGRKLLLKTKVCGHWKRQVCGKRLPNGDFSDRKLIFVEPYVKPGQSDNPVFGHDYHVG